MKKKVLILIILAVSSIQLQAQRGLKIGYVDMDYILDNVPEYQQASQQLTGRVQKWKSEIEAKKKTVEDMKQNLENERALLTKELIEERKEEIAYEEEQIVKYQQEKFGPQGALITQKRQLVQPVQDQVFNAIQEIGTTREYDFIYENSADALMLFSAKRHDISDQVLAMINRSSRKLEREESRSEEGEVENATPERYKSVKQAKEDKIEEATREREKQAIIDEREAQMNERQRERDSIREAKRKEYEERRQRMLEERERRRDSIEKAREAPRNNN
ncbi:OmpH family outer membrane protein [Mesonia aquimarina]|uniref:OmpH family outer membrane protein n=1 Tax=Mesonia aquimarina TaxID=1504967 RepID=UPI000EF5A8B2|nr:OmpH family outer membrane protein [Mesonia aquimarina]